MNQSEYKFPLTHTAWYSKGHYHRSDNVWTDLILCLKRDDYQPSTNKDVLSIIINSLENFSKKRRELRIEASDIIREIYSRQFTRDFLEPDPDVNWDTEVLHYLLSLILQLNRTEFDHSTHAYSGYDGLTLKNDVLEYS